MAWFHLVFGIILLVAVVAGLIGSAQKTKIWAMIARLCYVVLIVSGIVMFKYAWGGNPVLTIVKVVAAILVIGLIEMSFAKKTKGEISTTLMWLVVVLVVVVAGLGLWLSGGYPIK